MGPVPTPGATAEGRVQVRIEQGTRLGVGTAVDIVVTSPRSGELVLLDISPTGDMMQLFPNEYSLRDEVPTRIEAGEPKHVPGSADRTFPNPDQSTCRPRDPGGRGVSWRFRAHREADRRTPRISPSSNDRRPTWSSWPRWLRAAGEDSRPHLSVASVVYETVAAP